MSDHRLDRATERYGIPFTKLDLAKCQRLIAEGKSLLVERKDWNATVHVVDHNGLAMVCVVAGNGAIMTFLPPNALSSGVRRAHYADNKKRKRKTKRWQNARNI